jgi:hypothetical protein
MSGMENTFGEKFATSRDVITIEWTSTKSRNDSYRLYMGEKAKK